jgi:hypothetical protein
MTHGNGSMLSMATNALLALLDLALRDTTFENVLRHLGEGVSAASRRANSAEGHEDWVDAIVDEECDFIEDILGAAFVVCQTRITAITSMALRLRETAEAKGAPFTAFGGRREDVRALGDAASLSATPGSSFSKVEVLWALANYFKHRDEWRSIDWTKLGSREQVTVKVIMAAGLEPSSTGNLRRGARALGNATFEDTDVFVRAVNDWAEKIRGAIGKELGLYRHREGSRALRRP